MLFCGDLVKQRHILTYWTIRHFELTLSMLKYYDGVKVKGSVALLDSTLTDLFDVSDVMKKIHRDESLELLTSRSGTYCGCVLLQPMPKKNGLRFSAGRSFKQEDLWWAMMIMK